MSDADWVDVGAVEALIQQPVSEVAVGTKTVAVTWNDGRFAAVSGVCNHIGGPLGQGRLDGDFVVCPWHYWAFHRETGQSRDGAHAVPTHEVRVEDGRVLVSAEARTKRVKPTWTPSPLARPVQRAEGPIRVLGLSTTAMTSGHPRYSTSEDLLETALQHAGGTLGCETQLLRIRDLQFRACEGFYSKAARACTWPCSITMMDPADQMAVVYEAVVHWADVMLIATPIRWGAPASLYFKMIERMNCIQNQDTLANRHLLQHKVVGLVITGGQDNVQGTAGQMLTFFAELGCRFPSYPFIAHSRGWSAEDMENNMAYVRESVELKDGARGLADRSVALASRVVAEAAHDEPASRGGRKAHELDTRAQLPVSPAPRSQS